MQLSGHKSVGMRLRYPIPTFYDRTATDLHTISLFSPGQRKMYEKYEHIYLQETMTGTCNVIQTSQTKLIYYMYMYMYICLQPSMQYTHPSPCFFLNPIILFWNIF